MRREVTDAAWWRRTRRLGVVRPTQRGTRHYRAPFAQFTIVSSGVTNVRRSGARTVISNPVVVHPTERSLVVEGEPRSATRLCADPVSAVGADVVKAPPSLGATGCIDWRRRVDVDGSLR